MLKMNRSVPIGANTNQLSSNDKNERVKVLSDVLLTKKWDSVFSEKSWSASAAVARKKSFLFDILRGLGQALHFEPLGRLEKGRELVLGHVHFSGVHELQDGSQMLKNNNDSCKFMANENISWSVLFILKLEQSVFRWSWNRSGTKSLTAELILSSW